MRITFITTQINLKTGGGANQSTHLKARSMAELGHEVKILTLFPEKNSFNETLPYTVVKLPTRFKNWMALQIKIIFVLKKYEKVSDVFAFEGPQFIWGAGFYRFFNGRIPILMHFNIPIFSIYEHGTTYKAKSLPKKSLKGKVSTWLRIKFEKNIGLPLANHIDMFDADSPIMKEWHENFGLDGNKIVVLPEFADLKPFFKKPPTECAGSKNKINLIYSGRLVAPKGIDTLLMAIKELKGKYDILVRIVGEGRAEKELKELSKNYGLEKNVIFYSWANKETLNDLYHCSDIFVHPARWAEPFGITIIEAMAAGLPVITPRVSGSSWAAGEAGLIFENGDYKDLENKIEKLINNDTLRKDLAEKAIKRASRFDYRVFIDGLEKILQKLILKNKNKKII